MTKSIPQSFIDDLLARIDITEIISSRVKLRKAGGNLLGLCPFHSEKTPSFTVSPSKQFFHCFGCGAHGSAIGFLMQFENLGFIEAVETLASQLGIAVPHTGDQQKNDQFTELYKYSEQIEKFYQAQLRKSTKAINYLKARGLTGTICKHFGIGYAPEGWDNLLPIHQNSPKIQKPLVTIGCLIQKDHKNFARFRDRIMFPIHDRRGRVIGFGGRILNNAKDTAKYLNSPETPLFHKGYELFGLYEAKKSNKQLSSIIVVEGYMDVVALAQYGITNVVATLGTAITTKQAQELLKQTKEVIFCFDGDNAGRAAAWRALENTLPLMHAGIQAKFLFLPEKEDPDSIMRKEGASAFLQRTATSISLSDFFFAQVAKKINLNTVDGRAELAKRAITFIEKMPNGVFKELMLDKLSSLVKIEVAQLTKFSAQQVLEPHKINSALELPKFLQMAIHLLLNYPHLCEHVTNVAELQTLSIPGLDLFIKLVELLKKQPKLAVGAILEYWRDHPYVDLLATIAARELIIPESGLQNEFQGILQVLDKFAHEYYIQALLQKAASGVITIEEKRKLQELITTAKFNTFID